MSESPLINTVGTEAGAVGGATAPAVESPRAVAPPARTGFAANVVPLAVASALFMEFIDSTALSTALPTLARAFHSDPIHLKLALTSYLLVLAVVAPASGWIADRFGARRVFLTAMITFLLGSVLCGLSRSLPELVGARLIQGLGGAMMTPVGRLIVVSSAPRNRLVSAMTWFTMPALVGPLIGPPLSGLVLTVATWPYIFYINLPVGIAGICAVAAFVPRVVEPDPGRFDAVGFLLVAGSICAIAFVADTAGLGVAPLWSEAVGASVAALAAVAFVRHALRVERPIMDLRLLKIPTFASSMVGGSLVRLGLGASPLLTPLMFQVALGWSPGKAGLVTIAQAAGAMALKPVAQPIIRRLGFRTVLLGSAIAVAVLSACPGGFRADTPIVAMVVILAIGGFVRSLQFTSANAIAYSDMPKFKVSHASTLATVTQQLSLSLGVSLGGLTLHLVSGRGPLTPDRFVLPYLMVGLSALAAAPIYARLKQNAGDEVRGRTSAA